MWLCLNTFVHMLNKRATVSSISFSIFAPVSTECTYFYKPLRWILHWCGHISKFLWAQGQKNSIIYCQLCGDIWTTAHPFNFIFKPSSFLLVNVPNSHEQLNPMQNLHGKNIGPSTKFLLKLLNFTVNIYRTMTNVTAQLFNSFCHILNIHRN